MVISAINQLDRDADRETFVSRRGAARRQPGGAEDRGPGFRLFLGQDLDLQPRQAAGGRRHAVALG